MTGNQLTHTNREIASICSAESGSNRTYLPITVVFSGKSHGPRSIAMPSDNVDYLLGFDYGALMPAFSGRFYGNFV